MDCVKSSIPILKVLCDETRLRILQMLSQKEMNGCEINKAFDCTQPTISYHMKLLADSGMVHCRREGCCTVYSVNEKIWPGVRALLDALCDAANSECCGE